MRMRRVLLIAMLAAGVAAPTAAQAQVPADTTLLVSRPSGDLLPSGEVNGSSLDRHSISDTGRYVVFESDSDGLLPPGVHSAWPQVFRLDRQTGAVQWISHTPGGQPGNETSAGASISGDGTKVAYYSQASNIVPGDANSMADILVWDAAADSSIIASRPHGSTTLQSHGFNTGSTISRDGNFVVWESEATDLVGGGLDVNNERSIYRRNLTTNATILVSRADGVAGLSATSPAYAAAPSANADLIAFTTTSDGLDPAAVDSGGRADVFVRRVSTGDTVLVSRQETGATDPPSANGQAGSASISDSGAVIVFDTTSTDIVPGDLNARRDVFRRSSPILGAAGTTTPISAGGDGDSRSPEISGNGSAIAWWTMASNFVPGDSNGEADVVLRDAGGVHLLSRKPDGTAAGADSLGSDVGLDSTGSFAAFAGTLPTISDLDDDEFSHVYGAETTTAAPVTELSRPPGLTGPFIGGLNSSGINSGAISRNGRYVSFASNASSFPGATSYTQVYVRDLKAGTLELASRATGGAPSNNYVGANDLSADGRYVAFSSGATNLDAADSSDMSSVYVHDRVTGATVLVSRAPGAGGASADDDAYLAGISDDGMRVAFTSAAANLGSGADAPSDLYVRDLRTNDTILASRADGPDGADADQGMSGSAISGDGHVVAFSTASTNLGDGGPGSDVYLRNLDAGTTILGARADGAAGAAPNQSATSPALDANGDVLAFLTQATNFGIAPGAYPQLWVRDVAAGTTRLVSRADGPGGAVANGLAFSASITDDGSRVAFSDTDGSLTGEAPALHGQNYVRDLATEHLRLVSRADGAAGAPAVPEFLTTGAVALSRDGHCAAFSSAAPGLAPLDYAVRDFTQVYLRVVDGTCAADADLPSATPPGGGGTPPPTVTPLPDRTAPVVQAFGATRKAFAVGTKPTAVSAATRRRRTPRGTTLSWRLSEAATVRIAVARELSGRRKGKRCVKPTRKLRRAKKCVRLARARTLTRRSKAGTTKLAFSGRIGRKALPRGRYTLTLTATDAAGNRSKAKTLRIRIVKP